MSNQSEHRFLVMVLEVRAAEILGQKETAARLRSRALEIFPGTEGYRWARVNLRIYVYMK